MVGSGTISISPSINYVSRRPRYDPTKRRAWLQHEGGLQGHVEMGSYDRRVFPGDSLHTHAMCFRQPGFQDCVFLGNSLRPLTGGFGDSSNDPQTCF